MSLHPPSTVDRRPLAERVKAYGCPDLVRLDEPLTSPAQLEYLDLLPRRGSSKDSVSVDAVAEHQGTALLYFLDAGDGVEADAAKIRKLRRQLANRSEPAWLGIAYPGSLELHPIGFHEAKTRPKAPPTIQEQDGAAPLFFQSLVHGVFAENERLMGTDYVFKKIYSLLEQTIDAFVKNDGKKPLVEPLDVLSMAGRALFFRFLVDRRIVREAELEEICPAAHDLKDTFTSQDARSGLRCRHLPRPGVSSPGA